MKKLIASLVLASQLLTFQAFGETISKYENKEKKESLEYVVNNSTLRRTLAGSLPISFSAFQKMGFDYKLLGQISKDLGVSGFTVKEPTKKIILPKVRELKLLWVLLKNMLKPIKLVYYILFI